MRARRSQPDEARPQAAELRELELDLGGDLRPRLDLETGEVVTWTVENWITSVLMAIVGLAIIATITAKPQADGIELERRKAPPRPRSRAKRGAASSSKPGRQKRPKRPKRGRQFRLPLGDVGAAWIPEPGAFLFPARELVSARDIRDAILEAREQ